MRKLAFVPLVLLCIGAAPQPQPGRSAPPAANAETSKALRPQLGLPGEIVLSAPAHCVDSEPRRTSGQTVTARRLDQLPQGALSLTVMREVNGCPQSTTIREGYGAPAFRGEPRP
jgi:hypothetical protein